ncbi:MAG TPA: Gfo/Idh/MocA family oxidoreductase, partial [Chitinophagaceae bacterium]|nr:Gfo/Idh/MocA family oxidoreductase [Chitinophagaceae bacterium]
GRKNKGDIELVGVYEKKTELASLYAKRYNLPQRLFYTDLAKMLDSLKPEAVVAFGSIYDHMTAVEACAPRRIHVMVEKPLAVNVEHAERMANLAKQYNIHLLTNYETSWYPTTVKSYQILNDSNRLGQLRKAVFHHGHQGPKEIGVGPEFLEWLTDPVQNGGGALIDFGCYGANLMTYFTKGERPTSVSAVTRQFKPEIYPRVDDEATIVVSYPSSQAIIQASWNWPFGRKDMEIYGSSGYLITKNDKDYILKTTAAKEHQEIVTANDLPIYTDPFAYFVDIIRGRVKEQPYGLYSLENNLLVVQILNAARESAKQGKTIFFKNEKARLR